jgi:hypothetical protein
MSPSSEMASCAPKSARARENIPCPPLLHLSAVQLEVGIAEIF